MQIRDYIVNVRTGKKLIRPKPIDEKFHIQRGIMITECDPKGIITYANKKFVELAGYDKEEIIGSPYSLTCHPDTTTEMLQTIWENIKAGRGWSGYLKKLRKDGRYCWVELVIRPKVDQNGTLLGFTAIRKSLPLKIIRDIESNMRPKKCRFTPSHGPEVLW